MKVEIGGRFKHAIAEAIESGNYTSAEDVVAEAMRLFIAKEAKLQALRDSIAEALADPVELSDDEVDASLAETFAELRARGVPG